MEQINDQTGQIRIDKSILILFTRASYKTTFQNEIELCDWYPLEKEKYYYIFFLIKNNISLLYFVKFLVLLHLHTICRRILL